MKRPATANPFPVPIQSAMTQRPSPTGDNLDSSSAFGRPFPPETDPEPSTPIAPPLPGRLRVVPLGGVGEFGKNCLTLEWGPDLILFDCGMKFPEDDMFGVDMVIPEFDYLHRSIDRLRAIVLTHGHEDHIGAAPYLLRQLGRRRPPIYASRLTLDLLRDKLDEAGELRGTELIEVRGFERVAIGAFDLEFLPVNHSMPMALAVACRLPIGVVLHTGDFKFDPPDEDADTVGVRNGALRAFADRLGEKHGAANRPLLLLADSTNVERKGSAPTEQSVRRGLSGVLEAAGGTVIVAVFSSSLYRVQTVIELARRFDRKVAVCGYSLERNFGIAARLGLIHGHEETVWPLQDVTQLPPGRRLILTTGTQGEPLSALSRLSLGSFRGYRVQPGDLIVMSSRIIPGNERAIYRMINHFYRHGARVVTERDAPVHASGHAYRGEMRELLERLRPEHLVPIHGELRQLIGHRDLALEAGLADEQVHVLENGMTLELDEAGAAVIPTDHAAEVLVDGKIMDGVDDVVLRDRLHLSNDGMLTVILVVDRQGHKIIAGPDIVSRGFVLMDESEALIERCKEVIVETFDQTDKESQEEWDVVKAAVRKALRKFLASETDRYPVILPVVVEI
jgi:ribonuclease J